MKKSLSPEELNRKYLELNDNRAKERYKANFVLIAHILHKTISGQIIKSTQMAVARCFSRNEARAIQERIKSTPRSKFSHYDATGPVYTNEFGAAAKICAQGQNQEEVIEIITRYETISKKQYIERLN